MNKYLLAFLLIPSLSRAGVEPFEVPAAATNLTGPVTSVGAATTIVGPVPASAVDLSTVTTALNLKANLAGATFTGASGITNVAFTATGASGNIISASSITTTSGLFGNALAIAGSTLTVTGTGIVSAPSQPAAAVTGISNTTLVTGVQTRMFWGTEEKDNNSMFVATSSGVFTVPAGGAGGYTIYCSVTMLQPLAANIRVYINWSGGTRWFGASPNTAAWVTAQGSVLRQMAAGDTASCDGYYDGVGNLTLDADDSSFFIKKEW